MQVVLVYLQPFWSNSLLKCVSQPEIAKKFTKTHYFGGSRSFTVIDVDISKKLDASACYDTQHVCAYLQPFFTLDEPTAVKQRFLRGGASFAPSFEGIPFTQRDEILSRNTKDNRLSYGENLKSLSHLVLDWYRVVTDGRTELP